MLVPEAGLVHLQLLVRLDVDSPSLLLVLTSRLPRDSYGSEIRQFHEIRVIGSVGPAEDPNSESYSLGIMPEATAVSTTPKYGSGSSAVRQEVQVPSRLGGGEGLGWDEGGRYLTQTWQGGTICDKTGLPREVEVQVRLL